MTHDNQPLKVWQEPSERVEPRPLEEAVHPDRSLAGKDELYDWYELEITTLSKSEEDTVPNRREDIIEALKTSRPTQPVIQRLRVRPYRCAECAVSFPDWQAAHWREDTYQGRVWGLICGCCGKETQYLVPPTRGVGEVFERWASRNAWLVLAAIVSVIVVIAINTTLGG